MVTRLFSLNFLIKNHFGGGVVKDGEGLGRDLTARILNVCFT